jgi:hypothetical protein
LSLGKQPGQPFIGNRAPYEVLSGSAVEWCGPAVTSGVTY